MICLAGKILEFDSSGKRILWEPLLPQRTAAVNLSIMNPAALTALVLFAVGVLFLLSELLFGSDGSLSILALLCWTVAAWFAWDGLANPLGVQWWAYLLGVVVGVPILAGSVLAVLPESPAGRKLFSAPTPEEVRPYSEEDDLWRESFIGELGQSLTWMNPAGLVLVDKERHHAVSEGMPIEPGQVVEIIDVRANRFVVRLFEEPPPDLNPDDLVY